MMTKTLFAGAISFALFNAISAYPQGTVYFRTRDTVEGINAVCVYTNSPASPGPVPDGAKPSAIVDIQSGGYDWGGIYARAGLYVGYNFASRDSLVLAVPAIGFRTGAAAGYVDPGGDATRYIPGFYGGAVVTFQVRVWDTGTAGVDTYEAALDVAGSRPVYLGESALLNNVLLGNWVPTPTGVPMPPTPLKEWWWFGAGTLNDGQPIVMWNTLVPEPSGLGILVLGVTTLGFICRRKRL